MTEPSSRAQVEGFPKVPTLRCGGSGRSEDKLHHVTATPFYQVLLPERQNILRHIHRVEWLQPS